MSTVEPVGQPGKPDRGSFIRVADDDLCPSPEPTVLLLADSQMFDVTAVR